MSEQFGHRKVYQLGEVVGSVKKMFEQHFANKKYWIRAEISSINFHRSGHAYIEFAEQTKDDKTIAKVKGTIWKSQLQIIRSELGKEFDNILKSGMKILFFAEITFHKVFGLALNVSSIDLRFNLAEIKKC